MNNISDYGRRSDLTCGIDGCDSSQSEDCKPISVPDGDPSFTTKKCLKFIRSKAVPALNCDRSE